VTSTSDASFGHFGEQPLYQIQPTTTGRGVVDVISGVARQPRSHLGDLVSSIVVHHQVHVKAAWQIRVDLVEKPQELLMPVPPVATADRHAAGTSMAANKEVTPCRS
jgi:hypothetical protein